MVKNERGNKRRGGGQLSTKEETDKPRYSCVRTREQALPLPWNDDSRTHSR